MMTSVECLAKAAEVDATALLCRNQGDLDGYARSAIGWRRCAAMAREQEAWATLHPHAG